MKIKIIVPINSSSYDQSILAAAREAAAPTTVLDIESLKHGKPCIECEADGESNAPYVAELIRKAASSGYDGVFVSDMDMCGIPLAHDLYHIKIPVHGGFSSNIPVAAKRGRFIIMTILEDVVPMQKAFSETYGKGFCSGIYPINLGVRDLNDHANTFNQLLDKTLQALEQDKSKQVKSIVFGCSGFVDFASPLTKAIQRHGYEEIVVIDPNRTAIKVLEQEISLYKAND